MSLSSSWELKTYCFVRVTFLYFLLNFPYGLFFPYLSFKETSSQDGCTEVKELVSLAPQHISLIIF